MGIYDGYNVPSNADLAKNAQEASTYAANHSAVECYLWFFNKVRNNADGHIPWTDSWDYKQRGGQYADFGNLNYGVTGIAMGIPESILLRMAGVAQMLAGNSKPNYGSPFGMPPYGDDPNDQFHIQHGFDIAKHELGYTSSAKPLQTHVSINLVSLAGTIIVAMGLGSISTFFLSAKTWIQPRDPILLDLDGNGLETTGLKDVPATPATPKTYFDYDADGVLTRTGWAGKHDGLLVWDRNANGTIDNGAELFGDFTQLANGTLAPNGFAALAALDSNGDGRLDATDPAFAELKVWRDAPKEVPLGDATPDGQTGSGELVSLADLNIISLNLTPTLKNQRLPNGNTLSRESSYTRADGSSSAMNEYRLAIDTADTRYAETIEVPEALKSLPNLGGAGKVRELQQAAAQSTALADLLTQFQHTPTRAEQQSQLEPLLTAWVDTTGMARSLNERAGPRASCAPAAGRFCVAG